MTINYKNERKCILKSWNAYTDHDKAYSGYVAPPPPPPPPPPPHTHTHTKTNTTTTTSCSLEKIHFKISSMDPTTRFRQHWRSSDDASRFESLKLIELLLSRESWWPSVYKWQIKILNNGVGVRLTTKWQMIQVTVVALVVAVFYCKPLTNSWQCRYNLGLILGSFWFGAG